MFPLDTKTEERLASLIVDIEGAYQRTGRQLERLLRDAGWPQVPEYDGSPRVAWLTERIRDRRDDSAAVERLLCRVCDPLEYDGGAASAEAFRQVVNDLLAAERLTVRYASGRPVLGQLVSCT